MTEPGLLAAYDQDKASVNRALDSWVETWNNHATSGIDELENMAMAAQGIYDTVFTDLNGNDCAAALKDFAGIMAFAIQRMAQSR